MEQWLAALAQANDTRTARARMKRDMKAGRLSVGDALSLDCAQTMRVWDLLVAQRQWGSATALRFLREAATRGLRMSPSRQVRELTDRERDALGGMVSSSSRAFLTG